MRSRLHGFHPETELRNVITDIQDLFQRGPNLERRLLMALNANVQKLIDDVAKNSDLVKSNNARTELLQSQIADLKTQLSSIQAGQPIDQENLDGINRAVSQLEDTNKALDPAVIASTSAGPPVAPANPTAPLTAGTQPVTSDSAGNPIAPDAPGQPGVPVATGGASAPAPTNPAATGSSPADKPAA